MLDFQKGNASSFEALLKKYFPLVQNFIYRYTANRSLAEDLTQEAFLRVYKSAPTYRPKALFKTWIYTIARNISINEMKRKREVSLLDEPVTFEGEKIQRQIEDKKTEMQDESLMRHETAEAVKKAVMELPERQRVAIILRRYEDFSYGDIAKTMRISEKAVKSLLNRARENLRDKLLDVMEM